MTALLTVLLLIAISCLDFHVAATTAERMYHRSIRVGDLMYNHEVPFSIAWALTKLERTIPESSKTQFDVDNLIKQAEQHIELGVAHNELLEDDWKNKLYAINAFQKSIRLLLKAKSLNERDVHSQTSPFESFDIHRNIGEAYWGLAETQSISGDNDLAKLYYERARDVVYSILFDDNGHQREQDAFKSIDSYYEVREFYSDIAEVLGGIPDSTVEGSTIANFKNNIDSELPKNQLDNNQVASYLISSIDVFRESLRQGSDSALNQIFLVQFFTAVIREECLKRARLSVVQLDLLLSEFVKALIIFETMVLPSIQNSSRKGSTTVLQSAREAMADAMLSVSNILFRLGKYNQSQQWYQKCMDWSQQYKLPAPMDPLELHLQESKAKVQTNNHHLETAVQKYKEELLLVHDTITSSTIWDEDGNLNDSVSREKNVGHDGDLHVRMGNFYSFHFGDLFQSLSHLEEATRLYELAGEDEELPMAIAKYNLSVVYQICGDFPKSAILYREALDIFAHLFGEGNNPLISSPESLDNASTNHNNNGGKEVYMHDAVDDNLLIIHDVGLELNGTMIGKTFSIYSSIVYHQ
jgi:tetratricopeptide (TPR) repeat protein